MAASLCLLSFDNVSNDWQTSAMASVVFVQNIEEDDLADYFRLTDVALRSASEPERGVYIAESAKVIERALRAGHKPRSVLLQEQWLTEILPLVNDFDVTVFVASSPQIERLTGYNVHRGALAAMQRPVLDNPVDLVRAAHRVVILEDIVDHTNVGAIFRAVAGLGADAVLITPRCADPLYRRSVRVSMGTVLQVPWTRLPEWSEAGPMLKALGFHVAALALDETAIALRDFALKAPDKIALILGAEGDGLSRAALAEADTIVTIPMLHGVDSLNVAAASAVALYALQRQDRP
jgi:tRNA G18 (ribose-2'-O)-methylase SpoU